MFACVGYDRKLKSISETRRHAETRHLKSETETEKSEHETPEIRAPRETVIPVIYEVEFIVTRQAYIFAIAMLSRF